ncbi:MAG: signal peptidase I [Lachnospiraceae bacterium]|nr:signal peptidase I [Lachnospiraceae bacterium]
MTTQTGTEEEVSLQEKPRRERARKTRASEIPPNDLVQAEIDRVRHNSRYAQVLRSTVGSLIAVAAAAVLVATIFLPVLRIYGSSMAPTLNAGEIVVSVKGSFSQGDVVGLYVGNRLLVKRVIAGPGQWVDIREDGTVSVDGDLLEEPYLAEKALGDCNIEMPYQVPDGRYFVMGDHRATSLDSRHTSVGCIADDEIVGRIVFRVWPLSDFGRID